MWFCRTTDRQRPIELGRRTANEWKARSRSALSACSREEALLGKEVERLHLREQISQLCPSRSHANTHWVSKLRIPNATCGNQEGQSFRGFHGSSSGQV